MQTRDAVEGLHNFREFVHVPHKYAITEQSVALENSKELFGGREECFPEFQNSKTNTVIQYTRLTT